MPHIKTKLKQTKVLDDLYIQFSKITKWVLCEFFEVPLHKGMNGKHHFYGSPYKILKKFFPGKTKKPLRNLK